MGFEKRLKKPQTDNVPIRFLWYGRRVKHNILSKITALVIASFVLVPATSLKAQNTPPSTNSTDATPTPTPAPAPSTTAPDTSTVAGKIKSIDMTGKTFTVAKKKQSSVITFTDSTTFTLGKKPGSSSDLVEGASATATCTTGSDGKLTATSVVIKKGKKPAPTAAPTTTSAPTPAT